MYTDYLVFMEHTSGTIFQQKNPTDVSYTCYKKCLKITLKIIQYHIEYYDK